MQEHKTPLADFIISPRTLYISFLAMIVGCFGALAAILLMKLIGLVTNLFFYQRFSFAFTPDYPNRLGLLVIAVPVIGALLIGVMARYGSEKIRGHGIPEAMEAILLGKSIVSPKVAILKPISAAISIGSGGPFGAEGPIIMTGSSLGSVFGQMLSLTAAERKILMLAGAAAGMCATFNAPLSSVLFVVELLAFEMRPRSVVPIGLASGVADFLRDRWISRAPMFPSDAAPHLDASGLFIALGFGLLGAVLAYLLTRCIYGTEDFFKRLPLHWMWHPALGAVVIGLGGYFVPQSLGVGYDTIQNVVQGHLAVSMALSLLLVKAVIWIVALGSGTSGGILAPLLIIGGSFGSILAGWLDPAHAATWGILGMAAVFSGVTRSPFTTVVFLFELTRDANLLLPMLITCLVATNISAIILPRSILTEKIARRGKLIARDYVVDVLEFLPLADIMTRRLATLHGETTVGEALAGFVHRAEEFPFIGYPVVSATGELTGFITKAELLPYALQPETHSLTIAGICRESKVPTIPANRTGKDAFNLMLQQQAERLVVMDERAHPIGIVTHNDLMRAKRKQFEEETVRTRHIIWRPAKKPEPQPLKISADI